MDCGYCFGCMEQISGYPCPHCGYGPGSETSTYALQPGMILKGRYLVGKVLGQGGFGITYIGIDLQLQRKLAIKEYFPSTYACRKDKTGRVEWYSNATAQEMRQAGQEMVLKEARKMGKVSHIVEIVHVYDMFQENDTAYICMDFIKGITLMEHLQARGPLSWEEAKRIFLPAMAAMEEVHQAGLVHRDISPDNIMLRSAGGIRILDMGAAKDLNVNSGKSSMQVAKSGFSPPEQYMQNGSSGSWTDVYAMAATLYFALTGKLPLPAMDRMNPEGDALDWDHPQLLALPKNVQKAMKRAMELRIIDRIQTMEEFSRRLQAEPAPKPVPKPKQKPKIQPKSEPKPAPQRKPEQKPPLKSEPESEDKKTLKKRIVVLTAVILLVGFGVGMLYAFSSGILKSISAAEVPCKSLRVTNGTAVELTVGESHIIEAVPAPENTTDTVKYSSSDTSVASVTPSGKIIGEGEGETSVIVRCGTVQRAIDVVCTVPNATEADVETAETIPCESLTVTSRTKVELDVEKTYQITVSVDPWDTTDEITYSSLNSKVATVSASGKITAVGEGKTTIVISCGLRQETVDVTCYEVGFVNDIVGTDDGPAGDGDKLKVVPKEENPSIDEPQPTKDVTLKLKQTDIRLGVYYYVSLELDCDLEPTDVAWSSSHPHIVTVDENGVVTAIKQGVSEITATYGSQSVSCFVQVF